MRYRMIEELSKTHAVGDLCQLLGVTRSGYYGWCRGSETSRDANNRKLAEEIKEVFEAKRGRYGSPRITEELRRDPPASFRLPKPLVAGRQSAP